MKLITPTTLCGFLASIALSLHSTAAPISLNLAGTTDYDGWQNLTLSGGYSGAGFPGMAPWPTTGAWSTYTYNPGSGSVTVGAIGSDMAGSGDALLYKISNGTGGGPYPAGASIYFGGTSGDANVNGGTLGIVDTTPLAGLRTLAFQVEIGEAFGYDFYNHTLPTLTYTTELGTFELEATYSDLISQIYSGDIMMPTGYEDIYKNTWGVQFDLSGVEESILSYTLSFTGVQHAQLYSMQLDQSTAAYSEIAFPQAAVWQGADANSAWSATANWSDGAVPADGTSVSFSSGSGVNLDSNRSVNQLSISSSEGFTIGSTNDSVLSVGTGGIVVESATPAAHTIISALNLTDFSIINIAEGNDLTISGDITAPGFYKKGPGSIRLTGNNTYSGNPYNRLIILGGENYISGTNTYTGAGNLELNVKGGSVTLHGGDNRLSPNFSLNLVCTAAYTAVSAGGELISESTGHLILGDAAGKSDQTFAGIVSAQTSAFYEGAMSAVPLAASNATITGGSASISTLTSNVASGGVAEYWGNIGGSGQNQNNIALVKTGAGVQSLGGTSTYAGDTVIKGGMLRIDSATALSTNSNVKIEGGVLGFAAGDYSGNLGSGAGEIQFTGDGGFAAIGGVNDENFILMPRTVTLNGGAQLTWGEGGFIGDGNKLILSHSSATNNIELVNAIDLGSQMRTVHVENGNNDGDGRLSGVLSGTGGLLKTGAGNLEITSHNTYTGDTIIREGTLTLRGYEGAISGNVEIRAGAVLRVTNVGEYDGYYENRIADTTTVTMKGGIFSMTNPGINEGNTFSETLGTVVVKEGANSISTSRNSLITDTPDSHVLVINSLVRNEGTTLHFTGAGIGDVRNLIYLGTTPTLDNGILGGWATTGSGTSFTQTEFVTYGPNGLTAFTNYTNYTAAADTSSWVASSNIKLNAGSGAGFTSTLAADRQINSLNFVGARTGTLGNVVNLNGNTLRIESGGIIASGGGTTRTSKINNGILTAGNGDNVNAELIVTATGAIDIGANIVNNGTGKVALVKSGASNLTLTGNNTYTGGTTVNQGTLLISGQNTGGGQLTVIKGATVTVNGSLAVSGVVKVDGTLGGTGSISYGAGTQLTGSGAFNRAITVGTGAGQLATLSPGNSPGTMSFGANQTWTDGGTYVWEVNDVELGAGIGWDTVAITGSLNISISDTPFVIDITSLTATNAAELVPNFDLGTDYTWTILTTTAGITGFDASDFDLRTGNFANAPGGAFSISQVDNSLMLNYAAVPEPSTWLLMALGGCLVLFLRRRRVSASA